MKRFAVFTVLVLAIALIFFGVLFLAERKNDKGALKIDAVPESKVYLGNKLIGNTPFCACDSKKMLPVGEYAIKLIPDNGNFSPFEEKITINKSTLTVVEKVFGDNGKGEAAVISLIPLKKKDSSEVLVISMPDKANVLLDNNPVGITPLFLRKEDKSDHDLRIVKEGYEDKLIRIKMTPGYKISLLIYLGINIDLSESSKASSAAFASASPSAKVLILDTPTGFLRVREKNSVNSSEIGKVAPGDLHELISEQDDWFEIKFGSPEAKFGWISSQYAVEQ